jgi:hypothetical protein
LNRNTPEKGTFPRKLIGADKENYLTYSNVRIQMTETLINLKSEASLLSIFRRFIFVARRRKIIENQRETFQAAPSPATSSPRRVRRPPQSTALNLFFDCDPMPLFS